MQTKQERSTTTFTVIGADIARSVTLNRDELGFDPPQQQQFQELEAHITEEEIKEVIMNMPKDKEPGLDGFTRLFFCKCWDVNKGDINHVFHQISQLRVNLFNLLNSANVVLIPKKDNSTKVGD